MKRVAQYTPDGQTLLAVWPSAAAAARGVWTSASNICVCLRGRGRTACGYQWKYWTGRLSPEQLALLKEGGKIDGKELRGGEGKNDVSL